MQLVSLALAHAFLFFFFPVLDPFETGGVGKQGEREKKKKKKRSLHQPQITWLLYFPALLKLSLFNIDHTKEPAKYSVNWVHWNSSPLGPRASKAGRAEGGRRGGGDPLRAA